MKQHEVLGVVQEQGQESQGQEQVQGAQDGDYIGSQGRKKQENDHLHTEDEIAQENLTSYGKDDNEQEEHQSQRCKGQGNQYCQSHDPQYFSKAKDNKFVGDYVQKTERKSQETSSSQPQEGNNVQEENYTNSLQNIAKDQKPGEYASGDGSLSVSLRLGHSNCQNEWGKGQDLRGAEGSDEKLLKQEETSQARQQTPFYQNAYNALLTPAAEAKRNNASETLINGQESLEGVDASKSSDEVKNEHDSEHVTQVKENAGSSGKRRRSRWDPKPAEEGETDEGEGSGKKRKSRWAADEPKLSMLGQIQLPDFVKELTGRIDPDPEVQALNIMLLGINKRLQTGQVFEDGPRSPSPEPTYDDNGIRINTREYRAREKLTCKRQDIIAQLIRKNPSFQPPLDYKQLKLYKKLYIPVKEYPGYNFIGLIIGPRGNTQKRMEKETGAKIVIRGKGSQKEGRSQQKWDTKPDPSDNEDLHVLLEADNYKSLEEASSMIEKLLVPVDEHRNVHKRAQLRELAALNGTIRDADCCRVCGEQGHRQYSCPNKNATLKSDILCLVCGDGGHPTIDCPMKGSSHGHRQYSCPNKNATLKSDILCLVCGDGGHPTIDCPMKGSSHGPRMDAEYHNFLAELGGGAADVHTEKSGYGISTQSTKQLGPHSTYMSWMSRALGNLESGNPGTGSGGFGGFVATAPQQHMYNSSFLHPGLGSVERKFDKEIDDSNLYVGYLPHTMEDEQLIQLFSPFGRIDDAKVMRDHVNGTSKGFGFVKFSDTHCASQAIMHMNGYRLAGKLLAVRVAGQPHPGSGMEPAGSAYPSPAQQSPKLPIHTSNYESPPWGARHGSLPPTSYGSYSNNNAFGVQPHHGGPLQGGVSSVLSSTSYGSYGLYQMQASSAQTSGGMQRLPGTKQVPGNVLTTSPSRLNAHPPDAMTHFSLSPASMPLYQSYYAPSLMPPSHVPSRLALASLRGSLVGGGASYPWAPSSVSSGREFKAVESEYENFLSDIGR
eukprot:Gb_41039 [translate_table: standard]